MAERNFTRLERREDTRDKRQTPAPIRFTLTEIKAHFDHNRSAVRAQSAVAAEMLRQGNREEAEFIWRTQILYLESALDYYMHELTTYGMLNMYNRLWPRTAEYGKIKVTIDALDEVLTSPGSSDWLIRYVADAFGRDTLTNYPRIKDQADLLGFDIRAIMQSAFPPPKNAPKRSNPVGYGSEILTELCTRRNRIAHQTDRDPDNGQQAPITSKYVEQSIKHVDNLVRALHNAAAELDRRA